MASQPKVFISHTNRDLRDRELAHQLAAGLRTHGAQVWIAPDNIPAGAEWEQKIVLGILEQCTHFLVILSAASKDSEWIQKEINLARWRHNQDASFIILPLVVGDVGEYPSKNFIDRFQRVPYRAGPSVQLEDLIQCLNLRPGVPDTYTRLFGGFVGREYVFKAIEIFLESQPRGYFTIVGDPGQGKSAILAEYIRRTGCVAHFNIRTQGINKTEQCLKSLATQLTARYNLHCEMPPSDPKEYGYYWETLLNEVKARLRTNDQLVIALDALDEVDMTGCPGGANVLFLPRHLPEGIYLVMTRRRANLPFVTQTQQEVLDLNDYQDSSLDDIKTYIRQAVEHKELQSWIRTRSLDTEMIVSTLAQKSENNFMYLHYVLAEIERGRYQNLDIEKLPVGLQGYYEDHWNRMGMTTDPLPRTKIRIIYIMAAVRRPVSRQLLSEFAQEDAVTIQEVMDDWSQFLHENEVEGQRRYSIYHSSFLDFLHRMDIVGAAGETIENIHSAIANNLLEGLIGNE